jgi:glycosyltransferase involved in cell wall biosynthesis
MAEPPFASVVVCTQNRSRLLAEACAAALAVDYRPERWELVIVDNRSTDDTLAVAREVAAAHPGRVRVVEEPEIGLSAARNRGVAEAGGEVIAFLDDDAYPEPRWLATLAEALTAGGALAAGGPVEPLYAGSLPPWFVDRYLPYLTVWDRGPEPHDLAYNEYPRGANVAFHRRAFQRYGGFSTRLGRKGTSLLSCEETELCLRIERGGDRVVYVPAARVRHRVAADRITRRWLIDRFAAQGRSEAIVDRRHWGLAGLARGLRQGVGNVLSSHRARRDAPDPEAATLLHHCHRATLRGYLRSTLTAPLTLRRWHPPA